MANVGYEFNPVPEGTYWAGAFQWERTVHQHIWRRSDGKYHFSDEASQYDGTPYDSMMACYEALMRYCDYLNQPPKEK